MRQGEIYLVNFEPSTGREYRKVRPAIVIQSEGVSKHSPFVTVMPISSHVEKQLSWDILIPKDTKNRLLSDSVIKVQQISSFDKNRVFKYIGQVNSPVLRRVRGYLRKHFLF